MKGGIKEESKKEKIGIFRECSIDVLLIFVCIKIIWMCLKNILWQLWIWNICPPTIMTTHETKIFPVYLLQCFPKILLHYVWSYVVSPLLFPKNMAALCLVQCGNFSSFIFQKHCLINCGLMWSVSPFIFSKNIAPLCLALCGNFPRLFPKNIASLILVLCGNFPLFYFPKILLH